MRVVVLIESPFQLLQFAEYIDAYNLSNYKIIIRLNDNEINNSQLLDSLRILNIYNDKCIFTSNKMVLVACLLIFNITSDRMIIGDENSGVYKALKLLKIWNKKTVFLDDGTATLISKNNVSRFTIFDKVKGTKNKLTCITKLIEENNVDAYSERLIILGGKLSEVGICSKETYLKVLDVIVADIRNNHSQDIIISYIPHRGESEYKTFFTDEYCEKFNIEVIQNKLPVEFIAIERECKIIGVFGLFSTALFTMQLIYETAEIKYYVLSEADLLLRKDGVIDLYQILKGTNMISSELPMITQES
jgi:hypothetical protein